jgi:hypothetical protein
MNGSIQIWIHCLFSFLAVPRPMLSKNKRKCPHKFCDQLNIPTLFYKKLNLAIHVLAFIIACQIDNLQLIIISINRAQAYIKPENRARENRYGYESYSF